MEDRDKPVTREQLEVLEITLNEKIAILDCECDRKVMTLKYAKDQDLLKLEQRCIEADERASLDLRNDVEALKEELKANRSFGELWRGLCLMAGVFLVAVVGAAIFRHIT